MVGMARSNGRTALYRFYDGNGILLYVGITGSPPPRKAPDDAVDAAIAEQDAGPLLPVIRDEEPALADCKHPKTRVLKGLCRACGTYVGTKP